MYLYVCIYIYNINVIILNMIYCKKSNMYLLICLASNDTILIYIKFLNYCFISSQIDVNAKSTLMD